MNTVIFLLGLFIVLECTYLAQTLNKKSNPLLFLRYLFTAATGGLAVWKGLIPHHHFEYLYTITLFAVFLSVATGFWYRVASKGKALA